MERGNFCRGFSKNGSQAHLFDFLVTREWNCLKRLEGLGDVAFLEKVCPWRWALKFQKFMPGPGSLSAYGPGCGSQLLLQNLPSGYHGLCHDDNECHDDNRLNL